MIVSVQRLNKYMSSPQWSQDQQDAAKDTLEGLESTLESALMTWVTPREITEEATILASGLVATRHPVTSVSMLDDVAVTAPDEGTPPGFGQPLPGSFVLSEHRVRRIGRTTSYPTLTLSDPTAWGIPGGRIGGGMGVVTLTYQGGWGDVPALRFAILQKARAIMFNTHDDTAVMRNTDAAKAPPVPSEEWSDAELAKLGIFRNLSAWR